MSKKASTRRYRDQGAGVGLADLVAAARWLGADPQHLPKIAACLGFDWHRSDPKLSAKENPSQQATRRQQLPKNDLSAPHLAPTEIPYSVSEVPLLRPLGRQEPETERLFADPELTRVEELPETSIEAHLKPPAYVPLFADNWFRGIAGILLGTVAPTRAIDYRQLEQAIVKRRPLKALPYRSRESLCRGVQVFFDRSESMQPFFRDQDELLSRLKHYLGWQLVEASYFNANPVLGIGSDPVWNWRDLERLTSERPLLIVSDFQVGSGRSRRRFDEWLPVLKLAQKHRALVIALTPNSSSDWPSGFTRLFPLVVEWDRHTSPQAARQAKRRATRP